MARSKKNKGNNNNRNQNYDCQRHYKNNFKANQTKPYTPMSEKANQTKPYTPRSENKLVRRVQSQPGIGSKLVLFMKEGNGPRQTISLSLAKIKGNVTFKEVIEGDQTKLQLIINQVVIAETFDKSCFKTKDTLTNVALNELQKECFSVVTKLRPKDQQKVELPSAKKSDLPVNGIGAKIMEKMGWAGKGLGSKEQGRIDTVKAQFNVDRQGFGNKNIADEVWEMLKEYSASNDLNSMAFSSDFTKDERATIHMLARKLNLRSSSHGNGDQRFILVENIIQPWHLVEKLLEVGGENEQYKLITPTNFL